MWAGEGLPAPTVELVRIAWPEAFLRAAAAEGLLSACAGFFRLVCSPFSTFRSLRNPMHFPLVLRRGGGHGNLAREAAALLTIQNIACLRPSGTMRPRIAILLLPAAHGWTGWQASVATPMPGDCRLLIAGWACPPRESLPAGARVVATGTGLEGPWWDEAGAASTWVVPLRVGDRLAAGWQERMESIDPAADLVYGDEDRCAAVGLHVGADFKPDWSPETLLGGNYLGRALAVRGDVWLKAGGWEGDGSDSAFFSCAERCAAAATHVEHLPLIQLHRGLGTGIDKAIHLAAAQAACGRRGIAAVISPAAGVPGRFLVRPAVRGRPLVSVIIPTRDGADILRVCLDTLFTRTGYQEFEVLVVDNGSVQEDTRRLFAEAEGRWKGRFRVLPLDIPFNYSRLNNVAAEAAAGEHLLLLNNDIEIIEPGWLEAMLGWAQLPGIGFVGAKLLYPDRSVQHIGVTVGIGGGADHLHKGASRHEAGYQGCLQTVCNWTAATAACLLVPRPVWRQVGGLDESFAVAFNDVDFCLRVGAAGYRGVVTPAAELIHHESKSRGLDDTPVKRARFLGELARLRARWGTDRLVDPALGELISRGSLDPDCARPSLSSGG
jgi:GT2 family glycosyltransferase